MVKLMQSSDFEIASEVTSVFETLFKFSDEHCLK